MSPFWEWLHGASGRQRHVATLAGIVVLALLGWSVVSMQSGGEVPATGLSSLPASDGLLTTPTDRAQPGSSSPTGTATAGSSSSAGPLATDADRSAAPRSAGGPSAPGRSVSAVLPGARSCGVLTASDQGVTPTTVTVGISHLEIPDQAYAQYGFRSDTREVVKALVDDINKRGGVACRRLVAEIYDVNAFVVEDQRAACEEAAGKVFAFLDLGTLTTLPTQQCFTVTHKVPLLNATGWPASYVTAQAPYFLSHSADATRAVRNWVYGAKQAGFFDRSSGFRKLGLLTCKNDGGLAAEIKRILKAVGVSEWKERELGCQANLIAPPNEVTQAALDHKRAGVTHVFPVTFGDNVEVYLKAAEAQDFRPRYSASDAFALTISGFTEDFDPKQWGGTVGYTHSRSGQLRNGLPAPETVRCDGVLRAHGVRGITSEWDDFATVYCDLLHLLTAGLDRSPVNLTRLSFSQAVQTAGRLSFSGGSDGIFDRLGKYTGADFVRTIQWRSNDIEACDKGDRDRAQASTGCWFVLDPTFRPSR